MSENNDVREEREAKIAKLRELGLEAYPATTNIDYSIGEMLQEFESLEKSQLTVTIGGRVMTLREHGAIAFLDVFDGTGRTQGFVSEEELGAEKFAQLFEVLSTGDFIELTGTAYITKRGTQALLVKDWRILSKALNNIPTEHFGIQDEDERYRKRYLDLMLNGELRDLFVKKAKFWDVTRSFMKRHGFLEVETPTLEVTTGGAEARPFKTYHNDYDMDVFLRISIGELWQKHLMAAGIPKTFEIGRAYRNEGTSPEHLQEFTNMEFYWAYADYKKGMELVRELYIEITNEVFGTTEFEARGHKFNLADEWAEIDYVGEIEKQTGINVVSASEDDMKAKLSELGVEYEGDNRERLTDTLWKYCRKNIAGPAFLVNHPKLVAPLAKLRADGQTVEMFQPIIAGSEVGRGYSELNDPIDQRERFKVQQQLLEAGDDEAMMPDWEFVEMLEHGMPPTCGFGFGERLFAFLAGVPLREATLFPLMRPKTEKSKEVKIAAAVINTGVNMEPWQSANTIGHLCAELGVREGKSLLKFDSVSTADGVSIPMNIQHAIILKQAEDSGALSNLLVLARASGLQVAAFTREMLETTNDNKIKETTNSKQNSEIEYLGVLLFGPKSKVESLTDSLKMM